MTSDLQRFYDLLVDLEKFTRQGCILRECNGRQDWPQRGVFFLREPGEFRKNDVHVPRVVYVGTHAVNVGSKSTMWQRLRAHKGHADGGGNHRGSIFRLHVGTALLNREPEGAAAIPTWGHGSTAPKEVRSAEQDHERRVSAHIGWMSLLWVGVRDEPGPDSERTYIKRNSIALLSNQLHPVDRPSREWLGLHSPRDRIRHSGLWNLDSVEDDYDPEFLSVLEYHIRSFQKHG